MSRNKVLYANHLGVHVLRFVGEIRCPIAPSLEKFVDPLFESSSQGPFLIDLTKARSIDSTNLGVLARIAIRMRECGGPRVAIWSPNEDINEILFSMGFDAVFDIHSSFSSAPGIAGTVAIEEPTDEEVVAKTMYQAHEALIELNERNRDTFQDVLTILEQRAST